MPGLRCSTSRISSSKVTGEPAGGRMVVAGCCGAPSGTVSVCAATTATATVTRKTKRNEGANMRANARRAFMFPPCEIHFGAHVWCATRKNKSSIRFSECQRTRVGSQEVNDQEQMSEVRLGAAYRRRQWLAAPDTQSEPGGSGYTELWQPQPAPAN